MPPSRDQRVNPAASAAGALGELHVDSSQLYRQLVDSALDYAIFALDQEGRVITWNPGAQRIKGYSADEIIGRHFSTFYSAEEIAAGKPARELEVAAREGRFEDEGWRIRKDGSRFWANVIISALRDSEGSLIGFGKVTRDLTARREGEEQARKLAAEQAAHAEALQQNEALQTLNAQLEEQAATLEEQTEETRRLAERLQTMNRELEHALVERERLLALEKTARAEAERATRLRDEVLAIVAHDLRNSMHTIMASVSMLARTTEESSRHRFIGTIQRSTEEMERLVTDLLDVAHIESGTLSLRRQDVDVRALIDEAIMLSEPQAVSRSVRLTRRVDPDIGTVPADHDRLIQVLSNLIGNALKFTPAGGDIAVHARKDADGIHFSVQDSGAGISPQHLPHVFDRFWQANRTSRAGTGLGLAICKGIVDTHAGRMWVESELGRYTTVHFTIPDREPSLRNR